MRTLDPVIRRVPPWAVSLSLAGVLVAVALLKYGIGSFPQWVTLYDIGTHWMDPRAGAHLDAHNDYLLGNSLAAVVGGMTGIVRSRESYGIAMLVLSFAALIWPFAMPQVRQSTQKALLVFLLVLAGPVAAILMTWVGGYDALTVIAASLIGLARSRWAMAIGFFLAAVNHWSMALIAVVIWAVVVWVLQAHRPRRDRSAMIGIGVGAFLAGAIVIHVVLAGWGGSTSRASGFDLSLYDTEFLGRLLTWLPAILWSVLGVCWVLFGRLAGRRAPGARVLLALVLAASVLIQARALDATRDTVLPLLPAILLVAMAGSSDASEVLRGWRAWGLAAAAVVVPTALVFGWQVYWLGWGVGG